MPVIILVLLLAFTTRVTADDVVRYLRHLDAQPTKLLKNERGRLYLEAKIGEVSVGIPTTLRYAAIPAGVDAGGQEAIDRTVRTAVMTWVGGGRMIGFCTSRDPVYLEVLPRSSVISRFVDGVKDIKEKVDGVVILKRVAIRTREHLSIYLVSLGLAVYSGDADAEDRNFHRAMEEAERVAIEERRGFWETHGEAMATLVEQRVKEAEAEQPAP